MAGVQTVRKVMDIDDVETKGIVSAMLRGNTVLRVLTFVLVSRSCTLTITFPSTFYQKQKFYVDIRTLCHC